MAESLLAQRLRQAREYKGWSQTVLSKRSGVHHVQISKLERGITKDITGTTLRALCEAMQISPRYLLGMSDDMEGEREPAAVALAGYNHGGSCSLEVAPGARTV